LTGFAEFGVRSIYNLDIIQLKWLIEELDRPLHCIKNLDRRPNDAGSVLRPALVLGRPRQRGVSKDEGEVESSILSGNTTLRDEFGTIRPPRLPQASAAG
jgi:hypothetical protein